MKRTAALHTFVTAWILLTVTGILYSADQQKRAALNAQNPSQSAISALASDMTDARQIDRDEKMLGLLALVAGGFLVTAVGLYRSNVAEPVPARTTKKAA
jgi:hypothetical protein